MKEAIGGVFIFNIVIFFLLLFTGIMCLTINRSNAYQVKDMIITTIEENNGYNMGNVTNNENGGLVDDFVDIMAELSYRTTGKCPDNYSGLNREGGYADENSTDASICIMRHTTYDSSNGTSNNDGNNFTYEGDNIPQCYYSVVVFYNMDIPVIKQAFSFTVSGETKTLYSKEYCGDVK